MSTSSSIIAAVVGVILVLLGIVAKRRGRPTAILNKRDAAIEKTKEAVRKDVEKLEKRREDVLSRGTTADGLNDLIDRGDL